MTYSITTALMLCSIIILFTEGIIDRKRKIAGRRSLARFKLATAQIILTSIDVLLCTIIIIRFTLEEHMFFAGLWSVYVLLDIWRIKQCFDDNNWFNTQFKKFKHSMKKIGKRLSNVRLPTLAPAPNPA